MLASVLRTESRREETRSSVRRLRARVSSDGGSGQAAVEEAVRSGQSLVILDVEPTGLAARSDTGLEKHETGDRRWGRLWEGNRGLSFGCSEFVMSARHPRGDTELAVGCMSLEFRRRSGLDKYIRRLSGYGGKKDPQLSEFTMEQKAKTK